ncbi:MAG: tetratricopeptide repeat protein [Aquificaceae bacterium]
MVLVLILIVVLSGCRSAEEPVRESQWQYHYELGLSAFSAKNYSEAIANFFKASQLAPNEPKVFNSLGLAYMEVKEYDKSEQAFRKALEINKDFTESRLNLGILFYRKGEYLKAREVLQEAIRDEAFAQKHLAYFQLAKVYQALGDNDQYIHNLKRAAAYNPMYLEAQLELAKTLEQEDNFRGALAIYESLLNNGISGSEISLRVARAYYHLDNLEAAKDYIRKVLQDRNSTQQNRKQAYELLSLILIKEQQSRLMHEPPKQPEQEQKLPTPKVSVAVSEQKPQEPIPKVSTPAGEQKSQEALKKPQEKPKQDGKAYMIQVGAFSNPESAQKWREKLELELRLRDLIVLESSGVHKVYYGRFADRISAQRELEKLRERRLSGFIVQE